MTKFYVDAQGRYVGGFDGAEPPAGATEVAHAPAHAADLWNGSAWVTTVTVPQSVPMLNAELAMIDAGWLDDVNAYIQAIPGKDGKKAKAYWAKAHTVKRNHPLVLGIPAAISKTEAEVDALFIAAGALDA